MLENIGFYTLSDARAQKVAATGSEYLPLQMQRCEMIINETCNFKCPYCRGLSEDIFGTRVKRQLEISEITRTIDLWCDCGPVRCIRFSGGEPTLHKDLPYAVWYARDKGVEKIAVSTNGFSSINKYLQLVEMGVNDFSISLDAPNAELGDKISGVKGSWDRVVDNIATLSRITYVTVGVVFTPDNIDRFLEIVHLADSLGVADIRVIPSAQWDGDMDKIVQLPQWLLDKHPILWYRTKNFAGRKRVRGLTDIDCRQCHLVKDDSVVAGEYHFPCVIYMREQGAPIGKVGPNMRHERWEWFRNHDSWADPICSKNCLDVCIDYNNTVRKCCGNPCRIKEDGV